MAAHIAFIVVVVSFGWCVLLALCLLAMWHLLTRKKGEKKTEEEAGVIRRDEHVRVKEDIVRGPNGGEAKAISIEKDERFEKDFNKKEKDDMYCVDNEKGASSASK
ncbi:hypothetical protein SASPL_116270 [Salvia splendens]|uniref:Uncharacterized protein n=1 Tax=Salvia splendens TaxID=180675 RepID=A0A8X8ZWP9_SALSN|nr:hypothetical protein SASPL_116270 [Salvia splendens]